MLVWFVDSQLQQRAQLHHALDALQIDTRFIHNMSDAARRLLRERPDLLVVSEDPQDNVATFCRTLREDGDDIPIMVLLLRNTSDERIRLFEAGADDVMTKPPDAREMIVRIKSLLRRCRISNPASMPLADMNSARLGNWELDFATRTLGCDDQTVELTSAEFALLSVLVRNANRSLTRERLVELARGAGSSTSARSIDVQILRLRRLIEPDPARPRYIQTVWGYGYVLVNSDLH
jgi:two-component system phosphate regulon response regulator OmpR